MPTSINRSVITTILVLWVWVWFILPVLSQPLRLSFTNINQTNGLINDKFNYFISQDSRGFIWIGSTKGLNRLDGTNVRQYVYAKGDSTSLPEILIQSRMYEDANANLWFSTMHHLCQYVRTKDRFSLKKIIYKGKELTGEHRVFFYEAPAHCLWVKVGDYIYIYNVDTGHTTRIPFKSMAKFYDVEVATNGMVNKIYGAGWVEKGLEVISRNIDSTFNIAIYGTSRPELFVKQIIPQSDSITWLLANNQLMKFNIFHPEELKQFPQIKSKLSFGQLINDHQLILSTFNDGLLLFDIKTEKIIYSWKHDENEPQSLCTNSLKQLFLDKQNNLWINTFQNGVLYTPLQPRKFKCPKSIQDKNLNISSTVLFQDQIWCLAPLKGIYVFDLLMNQVGFHSVAQLSQQGISLDIHANFFNIENKELLLLPLKGVYSLDKTKKKWTTKINKDIEVLRICKLQDKTWLLENYSGVRKITFDGDTFHLFTPMEMPDSIWHEKIFYAAADKKIICSVNGTSICIYNFEKGLIQLDTSLELNSFVSSIWQDKRTNLIWIGTDLDLFLLDPKWSKLSSIDLGLGNFPIQKILGDKNGNIWCAGSKGIACYDPTSQRIVKFSRDDGFLSNNFNIDVGCTDSNGIIWLGSNKGLTCFDPLGTYAFPYSPKIYIKSLKVNNIKYSQIDTVVLEKKRFNFKASENTLLFELASCNFYQPENVNIYFRVKEISKDWQLYNQNEKVLLAGLPNNKYHLEWHAVNANGMKSPVDGIEIIIYPRFTQTLTFFLLVILAIAGIVFTTARFYYGQKIKRQSRIIEKQQTIQNERNRIADELHDDLGSGLSLIRVLSQTIDGKFDDPKLNKRTGQISEISDKLLRNMKDILWAMETKNNSLNNLIDHVAKYTKSYLTMNKLDHICEGKKLEKDIELQGAKRRNIFLIIKESLHNIVKHANAKTVRISLKIEANLLIISIQDDGIGIQKDKMRTAGKGLKSIKKRAADVNGELTIHSEEGTGTTITAKIPI